MTLKIKLRILMKMKYFKFYIYYLYFSYENIFVHLYLYEPLCTSPWPPLFLYQLLAITVVRHCAATFSLPHCHTLPSLPPCPALPSLLLPPEASTQGAGANYWPWYILHFPLVPRDTLF